MTEAELRQARELIHDFVEWKVEFLAGMIGPQAPIYHGGLDPKTGERRLLLHPAARDSLAFAWQDFELDFWQSKPLININGASDDVLTEHGLYGAQLAAKLRMVAVLALRFEAMLQQTDQPVRAPLQKRGWFGFGARTVTAEEARPRRAGGIVKALKDLISGIDVFADSVFDAVGIGKALKEIKELFGMSLEDQ